MEHRPPTNEATNETRPTDRSNFNRREFLKGSGAAVAATALSQSSAEADMPTVLRRNLVSSKPGPVTLNINGQDYKLNLEPRVTLLEALRNDLNITGAKEVDDTTASGADTILIDGKPVLASSRFAVECQGKKIETIESLIAEENVDEVIDGFVEHDALQCGFCTPGFVMATKAFVTKNPNATLEEIHSALGGNLCRCGTYVGITKCAMELVNQADGRNS